MFQIKGSIMAYLAALGLDDKIWSLTVDRMAAGLVRTTAPFRQRRPRVSPLPGFVISRMIKKSLPVLPKTIAELDNVCAKSLRTIVLLLIQFYTLARLEDVRHLRAADFSLVMLENKRAVEIFFRKQKNDQNCAGNTGFIMEEGGATCPYLLIKLFFGRMGFFFNDGEVSDSNFLLARLRMAPDTRTMIPDGRAAVCQSTLVTDIKTLAAEVNFKPNVSGKSAKIAGTSAAYACGLSDADIRDKGRWRSLESALHYRRTTQAYKLKLAQATSIQTEPWNDTVSASRPPCVHDFLL